MIAPIIADIQDIEYPATKYCYFGDGVTDDEITGTMNGIIADLEKELGANLRK